MKYSPLFIFFCLFFPSIVISQPSQSQPCQDITFTRLSQCNVTCQQCTDQFNICKSCPALFDLSNGYCTRKPDLDVIVYYNEYIVGPEILPQHLSYFKLNQGPLQSNYIQTFCNPNTSLYKFDVMGLFKSIDILSYTTSFTDSIQSVQFRFRLVSIQKFFTITVTANDEDYIYRQVQLAQYSPSILVSGTYQIPSLNSATFQNLIPSIKGGSLSKITKTVTFIMSTDITTNKTSQTPFWGIYQFVVITKSCETCITQSLKSLAKNLGIAFGVAAGVLIILTSIMFISLGITGYMDGIKSQKATRMKQQNKLLHRYKEQLKQSKVPEQKLHRD